MKWLKHAFAIDPPGPAEVTQTQRLLIDKLCAEVVRRRLTTPALLMLEMYRPFNYVSAQLLHFFQPIVAIITDTDGYQQFALFLEQRGSIDYLVERIETIEAESSAKGKDDGGGPQGEHPDRPSPKHNADD